MKLQDICIGDWFRYRYRTYPSGNEVVRTFKITQIENELGRGNYYVWSEKGRMCHPEQLEPIEITPELLEKNGFKIDKNETYCKRYFFACNLGKVPQTVVEFSFYGEGVSADTLFKCWTKPESCDGENSIHICDLKYVHQLQHALRLCNIDKEIVL